MNVFKNFLYNAGYQLFIIIVPLILSPYVSRVVGPSGIGMYSYTYSITVLFGLFANLGVLKYGNREISGCKDDREKRSRIFAELMAVKFVCGIVTLLVFLCYCHFFSGIYESVFYLQIPTLLYYVLDVTWFFWGMQEFRITTVVCIIAKVLSVVLIFIFVKSGADTGKYIFILAVTTLIIQLLLWIRIPGYVNFKFSINRIWNRHWRGMLLLFFPVLARYLYITMDKIMIGHMSGMTEVGYYENVQSVTTTMINALNALGDVVMPQMTLYFSQKRKREAEQLFDMSYHLITFLAVGIMFGFIGIADSFIPWFYGDKFSSSVPLLQMIAPLVLLTGYSDMIRNVFLLPRYKDKEYLIALIGGAVLNFIINFNLIPRMQSTGAVIGTLATEFFVFAVQTWFVRTDFKFVYYLKKTALYCVFGSSILIPCYFIRNLTDSLMLNIFWDILAGSVLYTGCVLVYIRFFEKNIMDNIVERCRKWLKR